MDVASACGKGDTVLVTQTFAQCFDKLSVNNQKLVYSYLMKYGSSNAKKNNPAFAEFIDKVLKTAKDPQIVTNLQHYKLL